MPEPQVTAIVPARNEEANIAAAVESLAAQSVPLDIIVVNDGSTDRTAAILADMPLRFSQLRVAETGELPPGWMGKSHALATGIRLARTPWLLLTDADVRHRPHAVEKGLAVARESGSDLVSFSPNQELSTWWEKAVLPHVYCRLARQYPYQRVSDPADPLAAANGQWLLISRSVYESLGGLAAIRGEVLDDVALARCAKQAGSRIHFARGSDVARTRMYRRFGEMWDGWSKNLFPLFGRRRRAVAVALAVALSDLFTLAFVVAGVAGLASGPGLGLAFLGAALGALGWRLPRYLGNSARLYRSGASVRWKGRQYTVAAQ
jgi:chlorobactene glucosyltransferase